MYFWPKNGQNDQNKNFPRHNTAIQWFKATVPRFWPIFRQIWCAVSKKMSKNLILRLTSTPSDGPPLRFKTINLVQKTNKTMYDWFPGKVQKLKKEENKKQRKTWQQLPYQTLVRFITAFEYYRSKTLKTVNFGQKWPNFGLRIAKMSPCQNFPGI